WALPALVALSVLIACGDDDTKAAPAAASAAAAGTTSSAAEAVEAPPIVRERRGSAIAMTMARDALLVASEDHRALFRVALPFTPASEVTRIAMPGAPAQIVALADRVLVTVRDPGQLVELTMGDGGALAIARKLPLAPDAWGLAVT